MAASAYKTNPAPVPTDGWWVRRLPPTQPTTPDTADRSAEVRLAAAMFDDALRCVTRNVHSPAGVPWQGLVTACDWIWDERRDWPFAFANVCDLLGLDAEAVRCRLEKVVARRARRGRRVVPGRSATVIPLRPRQAD